MIRPINETNSLMFKAVYRSNVRNANEHQLEVMADIKEKFSSKNYMRDSLTPVERYEQQDIDLLLKPGFGNVVGVLAVTNMKKGNLKNAPKYNPLCYIGTYSPNHEFSPYDVDKKLNKDNNYVSLFAVASLICAGIMQNLKDMLIKRK